MTPYLYVNSAEYAGDYRLSLAFNSGEKRLVDFAQFIFSAQHPDVQKYRSIEAFKQFTVADGDLFWNDYELCFPVDDLYNNRL
jgi:hypothetical protein